MDAQVFRLSEMKPGQSGDVFALLGAKEQARTRDDKPYFRATFKDAKRSAVAMIWADHGLFQDCQNNWAPGTFYKIRCRYDENSYGSQIEIDRIRPLNDADRQSGFEEADFFAATRFDRETMFTELLGIANEHITEAPLRRVVVELLTDNAEQIKRHSAAAQNHHAFIGGYLEHTLSVTKNAIYLADKYVAYYTDMQPPLQKSHIVAGAILHDIGKLYELELKPEGWQFTAQGRLVGHIMIGRDMFREKARTVEDISPETVLRLEHIILSHQNLPEWG